MNQQQLQTEETLPPLPFAAPRATGEVAMAELEPVEAEADATLDADETAQHSNAGDSYLLPLLQAEGLQRRRDGRNMLNTLTGYIVAIAWLVNYTLRDGGPVEYRMLLFFALICLLLFAVLGQLCYRAYRRKNALARELAKPHTLDNIGHLVEATRVENTQVRNLSKRALTTLLPQLKASDADKLTEAHRDRLLSLLTISPNDIGYQDLTELFSRSAYRREVDLHLAILKAYEQIGGSKELQQVERLAKGRINWQSASKVPQEIQQAASDCLPALQARTNEQRASEQLLRASSGNAVPADVLLRPAVERPDTSPEQLLRAGEKRIVIHLSEP